LNNLELFIPENKDMSQTSKKFQYNFTDKAYMDIKFRIATSWYLKKRIHELGVKFCHR
jgi:hypothetical protein